MTDARHEKVLDAKGLRKFGYTTGLIFLGLFALIPFLRHRPLPHWPFYPGGFFLGMGLVWPLGLGPVRRVWMRIGLALGWVNTRIILMVVYVALLTPLGLLMRLFGKDALGRRLDRSAKSYRSESQVLGRDRMTRPF